MAVLLTTKSVMDKNELSDMILFTSMITIGISIFICVVVTLLIQLT